MNLHDDDFALFGLKQSFAQDRAAMDARWKELQREAHPDKFASHGVAAQRVAMQWSVRINEAYQRLKDPLKRAAYLCELAGFPIQAHSNTAMPPSFLMQQMEWREALDDASEADTVEALLTDVQAARKDLLAQCEKCLDQDRDPASAVASVRALMFIDKFAQDLNQRLDQFE
ncbi:Fe-S protein assembly co-chaperone HscB [Rhodoferax mekongensis]|uniref:Fe-S protein assembly co-chaperone HscB n=1 Tax=Rhodoferax mekongensis TaxID=3068341 RepID=UPI0028BD8906|nr:Fe-S protein assembly co-chaperone HscB [Rhodoferax sp. TBRC 17199]MDT7515814.1 Fe-S protein assembly co-chaperone HscB [Rhodoferax sp. TBRC 17199]